MKYIVVYSAKNRKDAKRHLVRCLGKTVYFNSVEEAKKDSMFSNKNYNASIMTANYKPIK